MAPTFLGWGRTGLPLIPGPVGVPVPVTFSAGDAPGPSNARVVCVLRWTGFYGSAVCSDPPAPWRRTNLYVGASSTGMGGYGIGSITWTGTKADLPFTVMATCDSPSSVSFSASAFSVSASEEWDDQRRDGSALPNSGFAIPVPWRAPYWGALVPTEPGGGTGTTMIAPAGSLILAVGAIAQVGYINGLHPSYTYGFGIEGYSDGWAAGDNRGHYAVATRSFSSPTAVTLPYFRKSRQPATGEASALLFWPTPRQPCFTLGGLVDAVGPSTANHRITVHTSTLPGSIADYRITFLYGVGGFSQSQFGYPANAYTSWPLAALSPSYSSSVTVTGFAPGQGFAVIVTREDGTGPMLSGAVVLRVQNLTTGVSEYVELTCTTLSPGGWTTTASGGGAGWRSGVRRGLRSG